MKYRTLGLMLALAGLMLSTSGCTYMKNRGDDLSEFIDIGITTSSKPQFSLYCGFVSLVSLGYSNFEGQLHGLHEGSFGNYGATHNTMGLVVYGREELAYSEEPSETAPSADPWGVGIGLMTDETGPPPEQIANCPKLVHLGWAGISINCRFAELADFFLGWATVDIMDDDV